MLSKNHNEISKRLMQKVLLYIDSVLINVANTAPEESHKVLVSGLMNVRDALFSEVIKDNSVQSFNELLQINEENKKNLKESEANQENSSQENELEKGQ